MKLSCLIFTLFMREVFMRKLMQLSFLIFTLFMREVFMRKINAAFISYIYIVHEKINASFETKFK